MNELVLCYAYLAAMCNVPGLDKLGIANGRIGNTAPLCHSAKDGREKSATKKWRYSSPGRCYNWNSIRTTVIWVNKALLKEEFNCALFMEN